MILIRMNRIDMVAAETEEAALQHYERFTAKPREEVINKKVYGTVSLDEKVNVNPPWQESNLMTYREAFEKGIFHLPHVFTYMQ